MQSPRAWLISAQHPRLSLVLSLFTSFHFKIISVLFKRQVLTEFRLGFLISETDRRSSLDRRRLHLTCMSFS